MAENFLNDTTPDIVQRYDAQAARINAIFTPPNAVRCAACNGIETLRAFPVSYKYKIGSAFGEPGAEIYERGVTSEDLIAGNGVARVNAHSVIARASLENGMRIGLCEFVGAVGPLHPAVTFRAGTAVLPNGPGNRGQSYRQTLQNISNAWTAQTTDDTKAAEIRAALVTAMLNTSREVSGADERRALLQQQCAMTRMVALNATRAMARRVSPPDLGVFFTNRMKTLLMYGPGGLPLNLTQLPVAVASFAQDLRTDGTVGPVAIDNIGLNWATVRVVEFGHQCGPCELNQGALDMCGRFDNALQRYGASSSGVRANPFVGVAFSGLSFTPGSTVWDLSNALVRIALNQVYATLLVQVARATAATPRATFLEGLTQLMTSAPSLTTTYFQCLFMEMAYGSLIKILN